ncbi:hypothetical protein [Gellertiella hungarica]|uniref:Uncharacterized protein n=1 Tax=Gellertiella hungarica TaxID=1572859 RepID=A0A7W6J1Z6_9HYPH|nr:hypothetical protein [Gellertiella hungarica]MBB4063314.1 hypothetical protein [Gellertiella hungarica]
MTSVTPTSPVVVQKTVSVRPEAIAEGGLGDLLSPEPARARAALSPAAEPPGPSLERMMGKAMDILTMMQADRTGDADAPEPAFEVAEGDADMEMLFQTLGIQGSESATRADLEAARQELPPVGDSAAELLRLLGGRDGPEEV